MTTIECNGNKRLNMIITETAKNPTFVDGEFIVEKSGIKINEDHHKNDKSIEDILVEFDEDKSNSDKCIEKQINFIKSLYSYFAIMAVFDIHDMRPFGNIAVDKETGKIQAFDFDLEKGVTLGANLNDNRKTEKNRIQKIDLKQEKFLEDKPTAIDFAELSKDLFLWPNNNVIANMVLAVHEIVTGKNAINDKDNNAKFSIHYTINELNKKMEELKEDEAKNKEQIDKLDDYKKQLIELQNYKTYTANIMVGLAETIDKKIEELSKKQKLEEKEEEKLSFLIERRANVIAIFKETEIGKEANKLYTEKYGFDIEWQSINKETELPSIKVGASIDEKRSLNKQIKILNSNDELLNKTRKEILEQANKILKLKN